MATGSLQLTEQKYKRLNNIVGWAVFLIAAWVYWCTIEPTASFWDCSEFIAVDYKLQIGHPPGAPFLQLVAHLVSLLTFGNVHKVAPYINRLSATCSALTIMFLFWTITWFARKVMQKKGELTEGRMYAILGAGLIGALAYTFTDSFWFSAVEGEVYAMSSCFTAMVFWCITRWERADTYTERWIVFTFYLIGLSIGVHLLCLLTIPAVVFVYYFKTYPDGITSPWISRFTSFISKNPKVQGAIIAGIIAVVLLGSVQSLIIPGLLQIATRFELFFVNKVGLPFESGTLIYGVTMALLITGGLIYTRRRNKPGWNTAILAFTMLVIGYSSFLILVIRAKAHTPMNENNPSDAINLHAYLGRQQYGDWPLLYGQYYNAPLDTAEPYKDGDPVYARDEKSGKYIVTNDMKKQVPNYDSRFCTFFPRMYDAGDSHPDGYKNWGGTDADKTLFVDAGGQKRIIDKPTYFDNLRYFVRYQMNFMFWRYFMWNFCGRQNDIEGSDSDDKLHGNWITGIPFIDEMMGIPQQNMPVSLAENKARNPMYGLPLLLGLLGFAYQYRKDKAGTLVVAVFFFFTGIAIILYLNQAPYQPRERDYSYVGAFYAFAIWIGLGVLALYDFLTERVLKKQNASAAVATLLCITVPAVMAHAEWNDHDRSGRYTCRDFAIDYLQSCAPNAILFCNGDNDTFPLWYAQEVEGIRTDVRVCNLSLLDAGWYIDQMRRRTYKSAPLPISFTHDQYRDGTRDYLPIYNTRIPGYADLGKMIDFMKSKDAKELLQMEDGQSINFLPTSNLELKVDKQQVIQNNVVPASLDDSIVPAIDWTLPGNYVLKNSMIVLDILAHNDWKRPVYFTTTAGADAYMGLEKYFQLEGLVYRLVPVKSVETSSGIETNVATGVMYNNVMHKFRWGNMGSGVYLDENIRRMAYQLRLNIGSLANALIDENKKDFALKVLNLCVDSIPAVSYPYDEPMMSIDYAYYRAGDYKEADAIAKKMFDEGEVKLKYFNTLDTDAKNYYGYEGQQVQSVLQRLVMIAQVFNRNDLYNNFNTRLEDLLKKGIITLPQQQQ